MVKKIAEMAKTTTEPFPGYDEQEAKKHAARELYYDREWREYVAKNWRPGVITPGKGVAVRNQYVRGGRVGRGILIQPVSLKHHRTIATALIAFSLLTRSLLHFLGCLFSRRPPTHHPLYTPPLPIASSTSPTRHEARRKFQKL